MATRAALVLAFIFTGFGCAGQKKDYTAFRTHHPKSILVLPPLNGSTSMDATYGYFSTVSFPLAEMGYYVFPVAVVDQLMKENGLPTAGEMHQIPLKKAEQIFGADAVLYIKVKQYGSKYIVLTSVTTVAVEAKLVDTRTGTLLWEHSALVQQSSSGNDNLIANMITAAVSQVVNSKADYAHNFCPMANQLLFATPGKGLLFGPRHALYGRDGVSP
ncbi:MAG: hypothetical protein EBS01_12510 [Verrucomicrobia bacterium]|nr:hypothetical protein [Verrucomicrobiota bacterium]